RRHFHAVAILKKRPFQLGDAFSFIAGAQALVGAKLSRLDPKSDAGTGEAPPIELLAGVTLSAGRNVGMGEHAVWRDSVARENVDTKRLDCLHFGIRKVGIVEVVAGIVNFDADRAGIEVGLARPAALTGVPRALRLGHHLRDAALLVDEIMRRDLGLLARQPLE